MAKSEDRGGGASEGSGSGLRSAASLLFTVALLAATGAALYNVYGVSVEVEALASEAACQGQAQPCKAQFTFWERSPIAHTFTMQTPSGAHPVTCQRAYILFGAYTCKSKDGTATAEPSPSASASAATSAKAPAKAVPAKAKAP
ncbi:hypothetical protein [Polyangium jinanense]|uniref:Transmembrane protein n=1 Tax=Polyangium jinanense TaxID=2829994 RepID=A0A9X3XF56_9BACT|nr:hypothetical protein [Polyangium jinanense]MDC3958507.1 hypothetical protein [Polyangium jinanense]MDC3989007.1 hypothetical protein [Polyangium jinanense]